MYSRVAKVAGSVGGIITIACLGDNDLTKEIMNVATTPLREINALVSTASSSWVNSSVAFDNVYPRGKWEKNWDFRDPHSLVDEKKFSDASDEEKKKMLKEVTPTASRNVILIRHGQYDMGNAPYSLTQLGKDQAHLLGVRLAALNARDKFTDVTMSTMTRATETAELVLDELPADMEHKSDSLLEEGAPYPPEPAVGHWRPHAKKFFSEGARIEAAFRKYIHRASPKQKKDSFEVVVCHANVIRYFICRGLQFPPEGWLRMSLGNCSITWMVIRPDGRVSIRSIGDIGHLPPEKVTFN